MIEGYLVKYGGYLWLVKGCEHFDEYLIAYPRYDATNQVKIKDTDRALGVARKLGVVRYDECLKLEVPLVRKDEIEEVLDPFYRESWPQLPREISEILDGLDPGELGEVGLTGSYLASVMLRNIKPRDVDLVIKDEGVGFKIYRKLRDLRERGVAKPLSVIEEHEGTDRETRVKLLRDRVLEGVLGNIVYSIRIVSCKRSAEPVCLENAELLSDELVIVEEVSPIVMPYIYIATSSKLGRIPVRSLRMRYSEVPVGTKLMVSNCRLERYADGSACVSLDGRECVVKLK
jgi:hypothetical protein